VEGNETGHIAGNDAAVDNNKKVVDKIEADDDDKIEVEENGKVKYVDVVVGL
jgi:uncharacterized protein YuzE